MNVRNDPVSELRLLREVIRQLPAGVTVQDDSGHFLLVNDAAAAQFNTPVADFLSTPAVTAFASTEVNRRRDDGIGLLRAGRAAVTEELATVGDTNRTFLTAHRPVRIQDKNLLLSSSVDLTRQKQVEDELLRRAYFDELTGLPMRRAIEQHAS